MLHRIIVSHSVKSVQVHIARADDEVVVLMEGRVFAKSPSRTGNPPTPIPVIDVPLQDGLLTKFTAVDVNLGGPFNWGGFITVDGVRQTPDSGREDGSADGRLRDVVEDWIVKSHLPNPEQVIGCNDWPGHPGADCAGFMAHASQRPATA